MTDQTNPGPPLSNEDLKALIGLLSNLTGLIVGALIQDDETNHLISRAARDGLIDDGGTRDDLIAALENLIRRVRISLGEELPENRSGQQK